MKTLKTLSICALLLFVTQGHAQFFKKLGKRIGDAAEETIAQKMEDKTIEKTGKAMDTILNSDKKLKNKRNEKSGTSTGETTNEPNNEVTANTESSHDLTDLKVYSKFDFIPGNDVLFYDDFNSTDMGDFPSNWDTNGSGETVSFSGKNWFQLVDKATYIPLHSDKLPEDYTIEFDLFPVNNSKNSSNSRIWFWVADNKTFAGSSNWAGFNLDFWEDLPTDLRIMNAFNGKEQMDHVITHDLRYELRKPVRISIAVNKQRFRFWMNEKKIIDVPRLAPEATMASFKIQLKYLKQPVLITDFRIAGSGQSLKDQFTNEGRFTTSGIHFESGSATIKPESYGLLKKIAEVLLEGHEVVNINGHTDNTGDTANNQLLSEQRAQNVKEVLIALFNVDPDLISVAGMGENEALGDNETAVGRAQNRRVEFIKE